MKLIIEMDLGETQKTLAAGTLTLLCDSLGDESLARQQLKDTVNNKKVTHTESKTTNFVKENPDECGGVASTGTHASKFEELDPPAPGEDDGCPFNKEEPATEGEAEEVTIETVRARLAVLSKAGKQAEMKQIFSKVGATKLSEVEPKFFAKVLKLAEQVQI